MIKSELKNDKVDIRSYAFKFIFYFVISISKSKWHKGDKYKRIPVWFSFGDRHFFSIFIHKLAFTVCREKDIL